MNTIKWKVNMVNVIDQPIEVVVNVSFNSIELMVITTPEKKIHTPNNVVRHVTDVTMMGENGYAKKLYELLKNGTVIISLAELKQALEIPQNMYMRAQNLKKFILKSAITVINNTTDIKVIDISCKHVDSKCNITFAVVLQN